MKKLPLTRNRYALVDDEDFEWAMQWKWYAGQVQENHFYAMRQAAKGEEGTTIYLHKEIMKRHYGDPPPGHVVDHKDGDGLDDRKENLRYATRSVNTKNTYKRRMEQFDHVRLTQAIA